MENEEEKPKKKVRGPGKRRMKLKNGKKHEVLVRKKHSNVETGLSKYQLDKREEFLKVREGETHEQYVIRTKNYRVLTPEDQAIIDNSFSEKKKKRKEERRRREEEEKKKEKEEEEKEPSFFSFFSFFSPPPYFLACLANYPPK